MGKFNFNKLKTYNVISVTWFSPKYYLPRMAAIDRIISFKRESCFSTEKRLQLYFAVMAMITMMYYIQSKVAHNQCEMYYFQKRAKDAYQITPIAMTLCHEVSGKLRYLNLCSEQKTITAG